MSNHYGGLDERVSQVSKILANSTVLFIQVVGHLFPWNYVRNCVSLVRQEQSIGEPRH